MTNPRVVHVAVGVIFRADKILLAKRAEHQHQGGLWEFPGGKVELGEHITDALKRELNEELGITPNAMLPLIQIRHDYGDKVVLLDVWCVTAFSGEPKGQEGQPLVWVSVEQLKNYSFPAANEPIVSAITLPRAIAITPSQGGKHEVLSFCVNALARGADGFQLRSLQLSTEDILWLHAQLSQSYNLPVWVNSAHVFNDAGEINIELCQKIQRVHFASTHIALKEKLEAFVLHSTASCHHLQEMAEAEAVGINAIYVSPVLATASHPDAVALGWETFSSLVAKAKVPVYALGGVGVADLPLAQSCYAQGIAGISFFQV